METHIQLAKGSAYYHFRMASDTLLTVGVSVKLLKTVNQSSVTIFHQF